MLLFLHSVALLLILYLQFNGIYKGVTSPLIGVSIQNAFLFGTQRLTRGFFQDGIYGEFLAGTLTGALQSWISSPVEMSKIRLQVQNIGERTTRAERRFKGPVDVLTKMFREEGVKGPGRGFLVTLLRDSPGYGVYFGAYAWSCDMLTPDGGTHNDLSVSRLLLAGGVSGCLSWIVIYPIDVVKTRVSAEGFQPAGRYRNYAHCVSECVQEGGVRVFMRGIFPTLVRSFPVNAVTFCTVSMIERLFSRLKNKDENNF